MLLGAIVSVLLWAFVDWGPALALIALVGAVGVVSYRDDITVDPPSFARPILWGYLLPWKIKPRIAFAFGFFPIFETLDVIKKTPVVRAEDTQLKFSNVRTKADADAEDHDAQAGSASAEARKKKSGGSVEVHVGLAFLPDEDRSTQFIQMGKTVHVTSMLITRLGTILRHQATTMTWEEYTFAKAALSMEIITKLTGLQPTEKVLLANSAPIPDPTVSNDMSKHYKYKVDQWPNGIPKNELTEYDIEHFVNTALIDHPPDIHGLGIRLSQLGVTDVIPEGELKAVADLLAREQQERHGEEYDVDTELGLAKKYVDASNNTDGRPTITLQQALEIVRINRRPDNVREVIVRGSSGQFTDAAALMGRPQT